MKNVVLKEYDGLVTISWIDDLEAVYLQWHTEYDEKGRVIEAVKFALDYVNEHNVKNWWVDLSTSREGLNEADQLWVQAEFGKAIAHSTLEKLAMTPPLPETGQDTDWLDSWESDTNAKYEGKISARLLSSESQVREHFNK